MAAIDERGAEASGAGRGRDVAAPSPAAAPLRSGPVAGLLAVLCCLLWGSAFPSIKIGYALFGIASGDAGSQLVFAGVRFVLAGLGVVVAMSLVRGRPLVPARRDLGAVAALSLVQTTVQYSLFYLGLAHASGVSSSVIEASGTFLAILFACLLFRQERLTARKVAGCALGFGGVVLATVTGAGGLGFAPLGEGLVLLSAASSALSSCLIRTLSRRHDPVMLSGWQFVAGGATLTVLGMALGGRLGGGGPAGWALLAYLAFVSAAAYTLWSVLIAVNGVSRIAIFGFANPVFGVILSSWLLGEAAQVSAARLVAALALIALGVVAVNLPEAGCAPAGDAS